MNHILSIQLSGSAGAVIRTLGLIERRGFSLGTVSVGNVENGGRVMQVEVSSTRPGDLLKRQLERLHDVLHVELKPAGVINPRRPDLRALPGEHK